MSVTVGMLEIILKYVCVNILTSIRGREWEEGLEDQKSNNERKKWLFEFSQLLFVNTYMQIYVRLCGGSLTC